jgi:hypothetical protein
MKTAEDRVIELELVLRDLLEFFDQGPDGCEMESHDGLIQIPEDLLETIERATDVLENGE